MGPQSLLALQRGVGNAAVVQLMRQAGLLPEEHWHEAGCGHEPPAQRAALQRSAVPDILRSGGSSLDSATRTDIEGRPDVDFSDVRIRNDSPAKASPAEIGASAYTSGNHVVTATAEPTSTSSPTHSPTSSNNAKVPSPVPTTERS
ncbi:DUF4157 domain-containing protein [Candidatus Frankia alpina]|uniref:eCIS core domain-containing protein n=1 Tax=Candidatus Frankia alpina TaxID=2699483 RepID=UPI001A99CA4E|nr:DUF4157 domain-containing protein [Candidatus Frankia alpina]